MKLPFNRLMLSITAVYLLIFSYIGFNFYKIASTHDLVTSYTNNLLNNARAKTEDNSLDVLKKGFPVEIVLPAVNIKVMVIKGEFNQSTKQWVVSNDKAQFAYPTAEPNNVSGNTLIYAHNLPSLFGRTKNLKPGDLAYIKTDNNWFFTYEYVADRTVLPDDLTVFSYEGEPKLTLLTCAGAWDSQRRLMFFKLKEVVRL